MAYYNQGIFKPKNPTKYVGSLPITYRSSWELTLMNVCDNHPNIISWASESIQIPYQDPFDGRWRTYFPDFFIVYIDKDGNKHGEVIEIKPMSQTVAEAAKTRKDREAIVLNTAKWRAALAWCQKQGLRFRIMTQEQLYYNASRK